ncbi:tyrosine-type recombinase/integrase [Guggenheimella bovis]
MKINNKTSKPTNVLVTQIEMDQKSVEIERTLPSYLRDYCIYLKGSVSVSTRLAYLQDILFFFEYLVNETALTNAKEVKDLTINELSRLKARDVNEFLGDYCRRYYKRIDDELQVFENHNPSLARKKSSIASLIKFLFRNEQIPVDITPGFNPIKLPKKQPDAIKRLQEDELESLLEIVKTGANLTEKERTYWEKTKLRDKAIILLFVTYGLRLKELVNLDIASFNFNRREFVIYRKRDKESVMPLNISVENAIKDYLENERAEFSTEDALFLSLQGKRMTERTIREMVKKYTALAMQTSRRNGYSPHKLRATAASTLIERGFSIYDVQSLLDHENVTTTQLYAAHRKKVKEDIVNQFELDEE